MVRALLGGTAVLALLCGACDSRTGAGGGARSFAATSENDERVESAPTSGENYLPANATSEKSSGKAGERVPVVVELFSSEGCSSCPPADEVLRGLDANQPVAGVEIIPLELHVDYWNDLGWADPFSKPEYSLRQHAYADSRRARGVFTPEAIVDGTSSVVGSQSENLTDLIRKAANRPHVPLELTVHGSTLSVSVPSAPLDRIDAWLAITEQGLATDVTRGENSGHTLRHGPVVRSLTRLGPVSKASFDTGIPDLSSPKGHLRAVILLQSDINGAMVGAASAGI